jgi:hypothetical protein
MTFKELEKELRGFLKAQHFSSDYIDYVVPETMWEFSGLVIAGRKNCTYIFDDKKGHQTECTLRI